MTSILIFLLVLSVLIFVHELGHFLAAKACNVYVDRFSIGMPPRGRMVTATSAKGSPSPAYAMS